MIKQMVSGAPVTSQFHDFSQYDSDFHCCHNFLIICLIFLKPFWFSFSIFPALVIKSTCFGAGLPLQVVPLDTNESISIFTLSAMGSPLLRSRPHDQRHYTHRKCIPDFVSRDSALLKKRLTGRVPLTGSI